MLRDWKKILVEFDAIGTVGDGVTADIIKSYVEKQGTKEEKEGYDQIKRGVIFYTLVAKVL